MSDYEFRFVREDGRVAFVCATRCYNDLDARVVALRMMKPEFAFAEIWRGMERVDLLGQSSSGDSPTLQLQ
jgi:hypothetical protein